MFSVLSVAGLTVFAYTVIVDAMVLCIDFVMWRNGVQTLTQFITSPGHDLVLALVVALQLVGLSGLIAHFLS